MCILSPAGGVGCADRGNGAFWTSDIGVGVRIPRVHMTRIATDLSEEM
jgi:hypothetical protein